MSAAPAGVTIVVPTVGRSSLDDLLDALAAEPDLPAAGELRHGRDAATGDPGVPIEVLLVDDRTTKDGPLTGWDAFGVRILPGLGRGPAAARNLGWRVARHEWVAFLDDDVLPGPGWLDALIADLTTDADVGGVQGVVRVPLPPDRPATDWERGTAGLAHAEWITADMAYRREALLATGGFDERFPRAYREDAELAYRVRRAGWRLIRGHREITHPVRPESPWVSLRVQRGNADDGLLRRMYGPDWRETLDIPPGRRRRHTAVVAAGGVALGCAAASLAASLSGARGPLSRLVTGAGMAAGAAWLAGTAEFAAARIVPGPRTVREIGTMVVTSALIPPLATAHWLRGWWTGRDARPLPLRRRPAAVASFSAGAGFPGDGASVTVGRSAAEVAPDGTGRAVGDSTGRAVADPASGAVAAAPGLPEATLAHAAVAFPEPPADAVGGETADDAGATRFGPAMTGVAAFGSAWAGAAYPDPDIDAGQPRDDAAADVRHSVGR